LDIDVLSYTLYIHISTIMFGFCLCFKTDVKLTFLSPWHMSINCFFMPCGTNKIAKEAQLGLGRSSEVENGE